MSIEIDMNEILKLSELEEDYENALVTLKKIKSIAEKYIPKEGSHD